MDHCPDGTTGSPGRSSAVALIAIVTHSREPPGLATGWWYIRAAVCPPIFHSTAASSCDGSRVLGASRGGTRETSTCCGGWALPAFSTSGSQICTKLGVLSSGSTRQEIWQLSPGGMSISAAGGHFRLFPAAGTALPGA